MKTIVPLLVLLFVGCSAQAQTASGRAPALKPDKVVWLAPPGATDGRERAVLFGDPDAGSPAWTYRIRTPQPIEVAPHTHPVDEYITVLEGTWCLGVGETFERASLQAFPPGSFIHIPAGVPHFVATGAGTVIQSSGSGQFSTTPVRLGG